MNDADSIKHRAKHSYGGTKLNKFLTLGLLVVAMAAAPAVHPAGYHGCPFPSGNVWQTNISQVAIDPNSTQYLTSYGTVAHANDGFQVWYAQSQILTLNKAKDDTPMLPAAQKNPGHRINSPTPWQADFLIQNNGQGDAHGLVFDRKTCTLYDGYQVTYIATPPSTTQYSNLITILTQPFVQPTVGGNSDATSIPISLLAVQTSELNQGVIPHAIGWDAVSHALSQYGSVSPAGMKSATDGWVFDGTGTPMPYGSHARLRASFDISKLTPNARTVAVAMQTYGLYVYDSGCCNAFPLMIDNDKPNPWTQADSNSLITITPLDFDIVPPPQ